MLKDENGYWVEDGELLKKMAVDYFSNLFKSEREEGAMFLSGAFPGLKEETCNELVRVCTKEKIKRDPTRLRDRMDTLPYSSRGFGPW